MRKSSAAILLLLLLAVSASAFPKRIISTMPSITETLFALGLGGSVVGVTQNDDYPPEAKKIEKIGRETVNLEKVIYLMPDLVIMLEDAQRRDVENLKKHNLPVITINPHNIKETLDSIMEIGRVCGATAEATKLTGDMEKRMSTMEADIFFKNKQSVLVVVGYKPLMAAGNNSFINDMINIAGGYNAVGFARAPYPEINLEVLYRIDPQFIIIPDGLVPREALFNDPVWQKLTAVKNDRILFIDPDIISRPGPRIVDAIEKIHGFINR